MSSDPLYRSFNLASQKIQLEACFKARTRDPKVERVFSEVTQLLATDLVQQRLKEKRGCA